MTVLVTDTGFAQDDWTDGFIPILAVAGVPDLSRRLGLDLASPVLMPRDWSRLRTILPQVGLIRVALRHFGDGTALELARDLRAIGFRGRLRAHGAVAARFYTLLRRSGFSEVELDTRQARLQPAEHWCNENARWPMIPGPGARSVDRPG